MGIQINTNSFGYAVPGRGNELGTVYDNVQLGEKFLKDDFNRLPWNVRQKLRILKVLSRNGSGDARIRKELEVTARAVEKKIGIFERGVFTANSPNPTCDLARCALEDFFTKTSFNPTNIDGVVWASSTLDSVFLDAEKAVINEFAIPDLYFDAVNAGCAGFGTALERAASWIEHDKCETVLIIASDVNTRLKHPETSDFRQDYLFGDAAAVVIVQKIHGAGGLKFSGFRMDTCSPDFQRRVLYPNGSKAASKQYKSAGDPDALKKFGDYEAGKWPELVADFLSQAGELKANHRILLPEAPKTVIDKGKGIFDERNYYVGGMNRLKPHIVDSAIPTHGITGSPASLIAWRQALMSQPEQISSKDPVTFFNCAINGLSGSVTFDPGLNKGLSYYPRSDARLVRGREHDPSSSTPATADSRIHA